jgi:hypothetical protein
MRRADHPERRWQAIHKNFDTVSGTLIRRTNDL